MTTVARIHYEIPDELHREAKAAAAMRGVTLKDYVIDALQEAVTNANEVARRRRAATEADARREKRNRRNEQHPVTVTGGNYEPDVKKLRARLNENHPASER